MPATLALFRIHVPPERRGRVFGLFGATMGIAAAAGPALCGEIVEWFGWRAVFLANIPFLGLSALLLRLYPLPAANPMPTGAPAGKMRRFDLVGTLFFAASLSLMIVASLLDGAVVWATLIFSACVFAGFLG